MKQTLIQGLAFLLGTFLVAGGLNFGIGWFSASPDPAPVNGSADSEDVEQPARRRSPTPVEAEEEDPLGIVVDSRDPIDDEEEDPLLKPVNDQITLTTLSVRDHVADLRLRDSELQLIHHDYIAEQELVGKLRQTIDARIELATRELVAAGLLVEAPETQYGTDPESPAPVAVLAQPETQQTGLRRMIQFYDRMPEEVPPLIFQQMARDGLEDTVVLLLSVMNDRTMARILAAIASDDAALAMRLTVALGKLDATKSETDSTGDSPVESDESESETTPVTG